MAENPGQKSSGGPGGGAALDRQRLTATNAQFFQQPSGPTTINASAGPNPGATGQESPAITPPAPPPPAPPAPPSADQTAENNALQSASAQINNFLASNPAIAALDPTNQLGQWMNGQTATLYGQGTTDPTQIFNTIEDTMNNPGNDPAAKAVFDQIFPGYNDKIANGTTDTNGTYTGLAGYIQYANQITAYANTANLPPGTVTAQTIGQMWAGDISAGEVSDRITSAYVAATNAPKPVQDYLSSTYGMSTSDIAGYYLNPTNSLATLNAVNTGIAGVETGFGDLSKAQAASLSAFLAPTSSNGVNAVSSQQAAQLLTSNLGGGISGSAAQLSAYETAAPGASSIGNVSQDQLIGAAENNAGDLAAVNKAQQSRTASSRGGGGATTTANGAVGLGFSQS